MVSSKGEMGDSSQAMSDIVSSTPVSSEDGGAASSVASSAAPQSSSSASCGGADIQVSVLAGDKDGFGIGLVPFSTYGTYGAFVPDGPGTEEPMDRPLLSNVAYPAGQYTYYTPNMINVPRVGGGIYPDSTFGMPPIPQLAGGSAANVHRAWIRFHIADVDDAPAQLCGQDVLDLGIKINGNEVPGAFDNVLQKTADPDTFVNGVTGTVTIPFDPAFLWRDPASPVDPGLNGAGITLFSTGTVPEVFAIDFAEIVVDVNCQTQWPACDDGRDNDSDGKIDEGAMPPGTLCAEDSGDCSAFWRDPGCASRQDDDEANPYVNACPASSTPSSTSSASSASSAATGYCCASDKGSQTECLLATPYDAYLCVNDTRYADAACNGMCSPMFSASSGGSSTADTSSAGSSDASTSAGSSNAESDGSVSSGSSTQSAAVCGDGTREGAEECDDGNTTSGDGCSATCREERGWDCQETGASQGSVAGGTCGERLHTIGDLFLSTDGRYLAYSEHPQLLGMGLLDMSPMTQPQIKTWLVDTTTGHITVGGYRIASSRNGRFHLTLLDLVGNTYALHDLQSGTVTTVIVSPAETVEISDSGQVIQPATSLPPPYSIFSDDGTRSIGGNTMGNGSPFYATVDGRTVRGFYFINDSVTGTSQMAAYSYTETMSNGTTRRVQPDILNRTSGWYDGIELSGDGYAAAYVQARFADGADREHPLPEDLQQSIIFFNARTETFMTFPAACGGSSAVPESTCAPVCGDRRRAGGEQCDDGNTAAGDCCSATCTVENGCMCRLAQSGAPRAP